MVKRFLAQAKVFAQANKTWMASWAVILLAILLTIHFWPQGPNPIPNAIRQQADFQIVYARGYRTNPQSWKYTDSDSTLQFTVAKDNYSVVFTERQTPLEYQNDVAAYNRFIGGLRPRANFNVPLGTVSIANFVTAGDYQVVGETGILNTHGTLVLAHPETQLADDQWRDLFESLQLD